MENVENPDSSNPNNSENKLLNFSSQKSLIVFILVVLILAGLTVGRNFRGDNKIGLPVVTSAPSSAPQESIAPFTMVYGSWINNKSDIKAYDLSVQKEYLLAELPIDVKKVTVIDKDKLLYISETNEKDHGKNLSVYNLSTKNSKIIYRADANFGIDDYTLSKNKKYISVWEVSFAAGSTVLTGGKSRVYSLNLDNPSNKNLIYDEIVNKPVHYPRAITSTGEIFLDTFLPNSGAGWAYGMSVSNFEGTEKKDLDNMKNGTYGTQPYITKDEKNLVFSGYDKNDGTTVENGFRKALLYSNTLESLDITTDERKILIPPTDDHIYTFVSSDYQNGNAVFSVISKNPNTNGFYSFNLSNNKSQKIDLKDNKFISTLSNEKFLAGTPSTSASIGNLGAEYEFPFANFSIINKNKESSEIKNTDSFMQIIDILPSNFFKTLSETNTDAEKSLQLKTFSFKPTLAPKREEQQTMPSLPDESPCPDRRYSQCSRRFTAGTQEFADCMTTTPSGCYDSPLYVYGKKGTKVNIRVKTFVYNSSPVYSEKGYHVKLLTDGKMEINGKIYDRIDYDYFAEKINPPLFGTVTSKEKLNDILNYYAENLGLNKTETEDLLIFGKNNIKSPFVFVSFFDDKTSKQILPLEFTPKPDTYINIVFYFKEYNKIPPVSVTPPVFPNIPNRNGLTAVEISEIVEK